MSVDLLKILKSKGDLPGELFNEIGKVLTFQHLRKREIIVKPGQIHDRMLFIQNGIVRAYRVTDGIEDVGWLKQEGEFIVAISSYYSQRPSLEYVQTIEDTDIMYITRTQLRNLCKAFGDFALTALDFMGNVVEEFDERNYAIGRKSAEQRIKWLSDTRPDLFQRVPAQDLASYLKLSPAHFSRIRALQNDNRLKKAS
jgi:CRP-like cAMP-binding protein